jgi:hypothetical protein
MPQPAVRRAACVPRLPADLQILTPRISGKACNNMCNQPSEAVLWSDNITRGRILDSSTSTREQHTDRRFLVCGLRIHAMSLVLLIDNHARRIHFSWCSARRRSWEKPGQRFRTGLASVFQC